jgi:hypothetical protein
VGVAVDGFARAWAGITATACAAGATTAVTAAAISSIRQRRGRRA